MPDPIVSDKLLPREGFDLRRDLYYDTDLTEPEGDVTDDASREAFARGEWGYVGIVVVASRGGVDLGHDGIWGCKNGDLPGMGYVDAIADGEGSSWTGWADVLIDTAISNARTTIKSIGMGT